MKNNLEPQRNSKLDREGVWMTIAETIVVVLATWLNPQAVISISSLKLCFQLLRWLRHQSKLDREDAWMTIVETIVVVLATWLNPQAVISIFSLKFCFQLLKWLRHHHRK